MGPVTPEQVLDEHLELARSGDEDDFLRSYREDSFLIMPEGVRSSLEGIRVCYRKLKEDLPNFTTTRSVEQDVGFVEWSADSDIDIVTDGVASYVIRDAYIFAQTIHYTLTPKTKPERRETCD